jgi:prepilin signal peptidase PulO-like enzyme (type II secretory pathway)
LESLQASPKIERKWVWVSVWAVTTLAVGLVFFWLRLIEYKGPLWLALALPVFLFTGVGIWLGLGNDGVLVVYAITYGALASVWFLPSSVRWRRQILWLAWIYLGAVVVMCFGFLIGGHMGGGI